MKLAFLCPMAHITVIEKPESVQGRIPEEVVCSHIGCGAPSALFKYQMDENVVATHVFYGKPKPGDVPNGEVLTLEEYKYLEAGGLMFREIPEAVPEDVKKEFVATQGITKLAGFIVKSFPQDQLLPDIIDTSILLLSKYKGHLSLMKTIKGNIGKDLN